MDTKQESQRSTHSCDAGGNTCDGSGSAGDGSGSTQDRAGGNRSRADVSLVTLEHIADRQHYRKLRHYAFFGVSGFLLALLVMFGIWLRAFGARVFNGTLQTDTPHTALFLTPIIVIASLVVVSVLPLMRLVFQDKSKKDDDKPAVTLWQSVITELAEIFKQYLGSRSKPAG